MNYSFSRTVRISIKDIYDKPIQGAIVHLRNRHKILRADETSVSGKVIMDQVPGGVYNIDVEYNGGSSTKEVVVDNSLSSPIEVSMVIDICDQ